MSARRRTWSGDAALARGLALKVGLALTLGIGACVSPAVEPADGPGAEPGTSSVRTDARSQALAFALEDLRASVELPGLSAALVLPDGTVVAAAVGETVAPEGGEARALTPSDRMLSGSIGKTYVAATALRLVRDGRLELDAPLADVLGDEDWFERLPNGDALTLRHLLRHQSGLARYVYEAAFWSALLGDPDREFTAEECVAFILDRPAAFAPGEGFAYSDTNYLLVGMAIERVTGARFYDLARDHLLTPNRLADTVPSDSREIPGLVGGRDELFAAVGVPSIVLDGDGRFCLNPQFEWCGGGFANTPADLARWARILYRGDAFDGDYLEPMLDLVEAPELGESVWYGPGIMLRYTDLGELRGHDGVMIGYTSRMGYFPKLDIAVAIQTNVSKPRAFGDGDILVELARLAAD